MSSININNKHFLFSGYLKDGLSILNSMCCRKPFWNIACDLTTCRCMVILPVK